MKRASRACIFAVCVLIVFSGSAISANVTSNIIQLPGNEMLVAEHRWTVRFLTYHPDPVVPRRMYFCSSRLDSASPDMFVSLTSKSTSGTDTNTHCLVLKTSFNPQTGKLEPTDDHHIFADFKEGHGIASSANGSIVAVLARRHNGTATPGSYTKDILVTHPDSAWMTQPGSPAKGLQDQMWLLEWLTGDIRTDPRKYIVHKAIGSWEYGNNYLFFGENDNTYGVGLKTCVFGPDSTRHEADCFLVVNRSDYTMARNRGWSWAIGTGHTECNRPAYNPISKKYTVMGSTDYNDSSICGLGDITIHREDFGNDSVFARFPTYYTLSHKGGASVLLPMPDGGFIGLIINEKGIANPLRPQPSCNAKWPDYPPTAIGLVRFNATLKLMGGIKWVASMDSVFLSYPQLVRLDDNRFLLGFGKMYDIPSKNTWQDNKMRIPQAYYLVEIDSSGKALTEVLKLDSLGWGEQDQIVSLGKGRAAWAYIPNPALVSSSTRPPNSSKTLCLMVYSSQSQNVRGAAAKAARSAGLGVRLNAQKNRLILTVAPERRVRIAATRIFDARGRIVETAHWNGAGSHAPSRTIYFRKPIPAGVYFIAAVLSDGSEEKNYLIASK